MALLKVAISVGGYDRSGMGAVAEYVQAAESMGVDCAWSAEAWGQDAATSLAYLAAKTSRIKLGTGIMQISARVPSMTAMTALSMHSLSNGRFILGLGVSGPQVVEGLQGQDYRKPLTRLRETVDVIRMAFRGEKLKYDGETITLPRPGGEGKPIKLDFPPTEIPIFLATLGPKSLEYTGEAADGWLGTSFSPDHAEAHLAFIRKGAEKAGRSMDDIHLNAACAIGIGEDVEGLIDARRPGIAFQMGAMGSAKTNFYNEAFQRSGFQDEALEIQKLWIEGRRDDAAKIVPDAMITEFGAVGTPEMVRKRFETYARAGVSGITVRFDPALSADDQLKQLEQVMELVD
ncbi:LLM class flavin-dependent oxidoreductase [Minwuia sp.]|uniref:LLM class flavin-dependent oxidoreductase n=1 Tax=Minwuia sp. TaxID=2493630 RepID=UPI003A951F75